ncbi:MAG: L-threonylcarbamoyladenylate synthase [Bacteroidia bacterium]
MAIRFDIHPKNPQDRLLDRVADLLREGGVIIYPTGTMYGLGCDINNKHAVERICRIKGIDPDKAHLSCVCESIAIIGTYANHVGTPVYKIMRNAFPGPYTFILEASKQIPRHFQHKKTFGIRVTDHPVSLQLLQRLGNPIASISLPFDEDEPHYSSEPDDIFERYEKLVDALVDSGPIQRFQSTVIDASRGDDDIVVLRMGHGPLEPLGLVLAE